jgi:CHAT domain-containing protein
MTFQRYLLLMPILYMMGCNNVPPKDSTGTHFKMALNVNRLDAPFQLAGIPLRFPLWNGKKDLSIASAFHAQAVAMQNQAIINQSDKDTALALYERAFMIRHTLAPNQWTTAKTLFNIGRLYLDDRDFLAAQEIIGKALEILHQITVGEESKPKTLSAASLDSILKLKGDVYSSLGDCYAETKEVEEAIAAYKQGLKWCKNPSALSSIHLGMANGYKNKALLDSALHYLGIFKQNNLQDVAKYKIPEGSILRQKKQYEQAIAAFQLSINHLQRMYDAESLSDKGGAYIELAKTYLEMGQLLQARVAADSCIQIYTFSNNKITIDLVEAYNLSGQIYEKQGELPRAKREYEKVGKDKRYGWILVEPRSREADLAASIAKTQDALKLAYQLYQQLDTLIFETRYQIKGESAKLNWTQKTRSVYDAGIGLAYNLWKKTGNRVYLNDIVHFFAQNNAVLLAERWQNMHAQAFGGIPDSLIKYENLLYNQLKIAQKYSSTDGLNLVQTSLNALQEKLKTAYPTYYQLKYGVQERSTIERMQQQLPSDMGLIEYFYGARFLYRLTLISNQCSLHPIALTDTLKSNLDSFRYFSDRGTDTTYLTSLQERRFATLGYQLYQQLIDNQLLSTVKRLRIIRDGKIHLINFDALLTEPVLAGQNLHSKNTPYLIKRYITSYLRTHQQLYRKAAFELPRKEQTLKDFAAFIFFYKEGEGKKRTLNALPNMILKFGQDYFPKSPIWTDSMIPNRPYLKATVHHFEQFASQYKILFIGAHASANRLNPEDSEVIFGDTVLTQAMIVRQDFRNTQLAITAACQTGEGAWQAGEGILSIGHGFAFAGCPAVVESSWSIPEPSTTIIMKSFLENLKEGLPKDEALHAAKLNYITEIAKKDKKSDDLLSAYWAGSVLNGDITPIFEKSYWNYKILLLFAFIGGIFLYNRQRKIKGGKS